MTRALYTLIVGVIVMLAVPVSQLRTVSVRVECCCPDPDQCKCPDHDNHGPVQTTIKACHKKSDAVASASPSGFALPNIAVVDAPVDAVAVVQIPLTNPHDPPSPDRPRGPS